MVTPRRSHAGERNGESGQRERERERGEGGREREREREGEREGRITPSEDSPSPDLPETPPSILRPPLPCTFVRAPGRFPILLTGPHFVSSGGVVYYIIYIYILLL